jgi:hypothetical protein
VVEVQRHHQAVEEATRHLLRYLAVEDRAWARPEEALATLLEVLLAVQQAKRYQALAAERASRAAAREAEGGGDRSVGAASGGGGGGGGGAETVLLVDGVAGRFAQGPTLDDQAGSDRSAELLRLLLRRASINGTSRPGEEEDSDDDDDDDEW